jgi:drug/metabolite transporter (DMT)-like permease
VTTSTGGRSKAVAVLFLVGATLFWAGNYVVGAAAVRSVSPLSLTYYRWVIAVGPLFLIAHVVERPAWREVWRRWRLLLALGGLGLAGYPLLVYHALRHTSPLNAALINSFGPALIVVVAAVTLRERVGWRGVAGVLVGAVGVTLVLTGGHALDVLRLQYNAGDLLMLGAIGCWTAYTVVGRATRGVPPIAATAVQALIVVVAMTPLAIARGAAVPTDTAGRASLLFIGLFPSVVAYLMWNSALRVVRAGTAGVFLNLITVFTAIASVAQGKGLTAPQVAGGVLVLTGVVVASGRGGRPGVDPALRGDPVR